MQVKGKDLEIIHKALCDFSNKTKKMAQEESGLAGFVTGGQFKDLHARVLDLKNEVRACIDTGSTE